MIFICEYGYRGFCVYSLIRACSLEHARQIAIAEYEIENDVFAQEYYLKVYAPDFDDITEHKSKDMAYIFEIDTM